MVVSSRSVRSHPLLTRLIVASVAMAVIGLIVFIGLAYVVRQRPPWLVTKLGPKRVNALEEAYTRFLGGLAPRDRDGDSFPDSVEVYLGSDPADSNIHANVCFATDGTYGWGVLIHRGDRDDGFTSVKSPDFVVEPGRSERIRGRLVRLVARGQARGWAQPLVFGPGSRVQLKSDTLAPPNLPESASVSTDGVVEFEITIPGKAVGSDGDRVTVSMFHPGTKTEYGTMTIDAVWRLPPLACTSEKKESDHAYFAKRTISPLTLGVPYTRLTWERSPADEADFLYLEATPSDGEGEHWFPVAMREVVSSTCLVTYQSKISRLTKEGALKFRIVPARRARPGEQPAAEALPPKPAVRGTTGIDERLRFR